MLKKLSIILLLTQPLSAQNVNVQRAISATGYMADYFTTRYALKYGAVENGLAGADTKKSEIALLSAHYAVIEALSIAATKQDHPKIAMWARFISSVVHGVAAIHNYRVARSQIDQMKAWNQ